jgi:hypothetical protein
MMQENYPYQEGDDENYIYDNNDLKESSDMNQNIQNGKGTIIQISDNNLNVEDIMPNEENNKKLKKYQKFVKNIEYNKSGNVQEEDNEDDNK